MCVQETPRAAEADDVQVCRGRSLQKRPTQQPQEGWNHVNVQQGVLLPRLGQQPSPGPLHLVAVVLDWL